MADNPFLAADKAKRDAIQEEKARKAREAEAERQRALQLAKQSRRADAMIAKGRMLVDTVKEKEKILETEAEERLRAAEERKMREQRELEEQQRLAREAREEEKRRAAAEAERQRQAELQKQAEIERVREQRRLAEQKRLQAFKESELLAERRGAILAESKQLLSLVDKARAEGRLPPHFVPSLAWLCQNIAAVRFMLFPPTEPAAPTRSMPRVRAPRKEWVAPIAESSTDDPPTPSRRIPPTHVQSLAPAPASSASAPATPAAPFARGSRASLDSPGVPRPLFSPPKAQVRPSGTSTASSSAASSTPTSPPTVVDPARAAERAAQIARIEKMRSLHESTLTEAQREAAARLEALRRAPTPGSLQPRPVVPAATAATVSHERAAVEAQLDSEEEDEVQEGFSSLSFVAGKQGTPARRTLSADGTGPRNLMAGGDALQYLSERKEIVTPSGTVRGRKHLVRSVLELFAGPSSQFESPLQERLFMEEKGKIVVYVTSLQAIRERYEACQRVLKVFETLRLKIQVKDITMDSRFISELEERLNGAVVPQVFVSFIHIGDADRIVELNESGQLRTMLAGFEPRPVLACGGCGGFGYRPCSWCQGSKKSLVHNFSKDTNSNALRCTVCNENGLEKCDLC